MNKKKSINLENKLKNFHKRWNIELSENERWNEFKNRVLNSFISILEFELILDDNIDDEFLKFIGKHETPKFIV